MEGQARQHRAGTDLLAIEQKLTQFQNLYSSYRREEALGRDEPSLRTSLALPSPRHTGTVPGPSKVSPAKPLSPARPAIDLPRRTSISGRPQTAYRDPTASSSEAVAGVQRLLAELDTKDRTTSNLNSQLQKLQSQLHLQEAREDETRANLQRQVQQLQEKLAVTTEQLHRLETERWEVLEAVSTVAAGSAALDREQRDLERSRLALVDKQREVTAREAMAAASLQVSVAPERLSVEDLTLLRGHYAELDTAITRTDSAVRRRVLLLAGHDPDGPAALPGRGGEGQGVDMSHEPCLAYLQVTMAVSQDVRDSMISANAYLTRNGSAERHLSVASAAPVVRQLQQQAAGMARALLLLASEAEADAARLALIEAQGKERDSLLAAAQAENRRLAAAAASAKQAETLAEQLQAQRQENEALQTKLRSMRKKLKAAFEEMAAANKELREKLAAEQAARSSDTSRHSKEVEKLQADLVSARDRLQSQQQRDVQLLGELHDAREAAAQAEARGQELQAGVEAARKALEDADGRIDELQAELLAEREAAIQTSSNHESQLADLRSEVRQQLQAVVDAYSDELEALQQQLARVEAQQAASQQQLQAAAQRSSSAATAAATAGAGRADAWRAAYEEVRELAQSLKTQLDAAEDENVRLQGQLQKLTAAAVASAAASLGAKDAAAKRPPAPAPPARLPSLDSYRDSADSSHRGTATASRDSSYRQLPTAPEPEPVASMPPAPPLRPPTAQPLAPAVPPPPQPVPAPAPAPAPAAVPASAPTPPPPVAPVQAPASQLGSQDRIPAEVEARTPTRMRSVGVETAELPSTPTPLGVMLAAVGEALGRMSSPAWGSATSAGQGAGLSARSRADAAAATDRPMLRQQSMQTEPAAAAEPPRPASSVALDEDRGANRLVIVVRQETAPAPAPATIPAAPLAAPGPELPAQPPYPQQQQRRSSARPEEEAIASSPSESASPFIREDGRSRSRTRSHSRAASRSGPPSSSAHRSSTRRGPAPASTPARGPGPASHAAPGSGRYRNMGTATEPEPEPEPSVTETARSSEGGRSEEADEEAATEAGTDPGMDREALSQHVAALEEQLAALTYQNSVITLDVIEMRQRQQLHLEHEAEREQRASRDGPQAYVSRSYHQATYAYRSSAAHAAHESGLGVPGRPAQPIDAWPQDSRQEAVAPPAPGAYSRAAGTGGGGSRGAVYQPYAAGASRSGTAGYSPPEAEHEQYGGPQYGDRYEAEPVRANPARDRPYGSAGSGYSAARPQPHPEPYSDPYSGAYGQPEEQSQQARAPGTRDVVAHTSPDLSSAPLMGSPDDPYAYKPEQTYDRRPSYPDVPPRSSAAGLAATASASRVAASWQQQQQTSARGGVDARYPPEEYAGAERYPEPPVRPPHMHPPPPQAPEPPAQQLPAGGPQAGGGSAVAEEVAMLRALYSDLMQRYEQQAERQQELTEAMQRMASSGARKARAGGGGGGSGVASSSAASVTAAEATTAEPANPASAGRAPLGSGAARSSVPPYPAPQRQPTTPPPAAPPPPAQPTAPLPIQQSSPAHTASPSSTASPVSFSPSYSNGYRGQYGLPPLDPEALPPGHPLQAVAPVDPDGSEHRMSWKDAADVMVAGGGAGGPDTGLGASGPTPSELEAGVVPAGGRDLGPGSTAAGGASSIGAGSIGAWSGSASFDAGSHGSGRGTRDGAEGGDEFEEEEEEGNHHGPAGGFHEPLGSAARRADTAWAGQQHQQPRTHHHRRPRPHHYHHHAHGPKAKTLRLTPPVGSPAPQQPQPLPPHEAQVLQPQRPVGLVLADFPAPSPSRQSAAQQTRTAPFQPPAPPLSLTLLPPQQPQSVSSPQFRSGPPAPHVAGSRPLSPPPAGPPSTRPSASGGLPWSQPLSAQPSSSAVTPTTSVTGAPPLVPQRSGDMYITTTPFFPLGAETSDFLDRATSVEIGLRPDPDLATSAADAGRSGTGHGSLGMYGDDDDLDYDPDLLGPEDDDLDDLEVGDLGDGHEEDDGHEAGARATVGSSSTFTLEEDEDPAAALEDGDEEDDEGVMSGGMARSATGSSSSSGTATGNGHGPQPMPRSSAPEHTTCSFLPVREEGGSGSDAAARPLAAQQPEPPPAVQVPPSPGGAGAGAGPSRRPELEHPFAPPPTPQGQAGPDGPMDGPLVPQEVLERMAKYAGDEGLARPSTAVPSALRQDPSDQGPPVPPEVLSYLEQYTGGGEGDVRPSTASPSVLRARAQREAPVPPEVLNYVQQYTGDEGGARPSSAAPSVLLPPSSGRSLPAELPAPELVVHMAAHFQTGGEGVSRPTTAPSSDERRARLSTAASAPVPLPSHPGALASPGSTPAPSPAHPASATTSASGLPPPWASPAAQPPPRLELRPPPGPSAVLKGSAPIASPSAKRESGGSDDGSRAARWGGSASAFRQMPPGLVLGPQDIAYGFGPGDGSGGEGEGAAMRSFGSGVEGEPLYEGEGALEGEDEGEGGEGEGEVEEGGEADQAEAEGEEGEGEVGLGEGEMEEGGFDGMDGEDLVGPDEAVEGFGPGVEAEDGDEGEWDPSQWEVPGLEEGEEEAEDLADWGPGFGEEGDEFALGSSAEEAFATNRLSEEGGVQGPLGDAGAGPAAAGAGNGLEVEAGDEEGGFGGSAGGGGAASSAAAGLRQGLMPLVPSAQMPPPSPQDLPSPQPRQPHESSPPEAPPQPRTERERDSPPPRPGTAVGQQRQQPPLGAGGWPQSAAGGLHLQPPVHYAQQGEEEDDDDDVFGEGGGFRVVVGSWLQPQAPLPSQAQAQAQAPPNAPGGAGFADGGVFGARGGAALPAVVAHSLGRELEAEQPYSPAAMDADPRGMVARLGSESEGSGLEGAEGVWGAGGARGGGSSDSDSVF
ncbi:hypothetical protein HYH03_014799 [Edaphochlamys debaryana]|uniref:Uncharacterized protein n=1 Tax=Edaphochlamys debaryana TaxID=47281 RepID=A0A835XKL1_9CHLO|nr:hypothetical protein HYH03_014799 [Edaphochlamys debaryana]|eukprot:KAG2486497.1 hypothetical protein HYH03_014799 [Edaphochlamys debaryana]